MANTKVTTGVIKDDAVGADQLASNSVVTASIVDNAITTAKINNDAILTDKISDNAVTNAKLSSNSVDSDQYVDASIDTAHIGDGQITSAKLDTNISISGTLTVGSHLSLGDSDILKIGASSDLQLYHDGTDSNIQNATGNLYIYGGSNHIRIRPTNNQESVLAYPAGQVELYYAGAKKFETTSSGVDVTGNITVGTNDTIIAENNIRFKPTGASYIDHNTTGQNINFRLSNSSSLDVTPLVISPTTVTVAGNLSVDGGTIKLDGNYPTGTNNVALGNTALDSVSGNNNTAIGTSALTANTTGGQNTAIGTNAMAANTTGYDNTAVGRMALDANTTGISNVAIGEASLTSSTTASRNVSIGKDSMVFNTTGAECVAVGEGALNKNTTASNNTAVGRRALFANTTGTNNTALGSKALQANTTSNNNTAVGYIALGANTTGTGNTAIGMSALDANTTASDNTAIGQYALSTSTTGANNTAVGQVAGFDLTTGSNNIFIGKDSGRSGSPGGSQTTGSNEIFLGDENITAANIQVSWTVASDKRDKTDIEPVKMGLDFVNALEPVTYRWDKRSLYVEKDENINDVIPDGTHKENWLDVGFLAQDVEKLESEYGYNISDKTNLTTSVTDNGHQYSLKYSKFVPMLVKSIQELSSQVDELKAEIQELKG